MNTTLRIARPVSVAAVALLTGALLPMTASADQTYYVPVTTWTSAATATATVTG